MLSLCRIHYDRKLTLNNGIYLHIHYDLNSNPPLYENYFNLLAVNLGGENFDNML